MELKKYIFGLQGRISRSTFLYSVILLSLIFLVLYVFLDSLLSHNSTLVLYPPFFWTLFVLSMKRYHDLSKSCFWLLLLLIPVIGPLWVILELLFRKGTDGENPYGDDPLIPDIDYLTIK